MKILKENLTEKEFYNYIENVEMKMYNNNEEIETIEWGDYDETVPFYNVKRKHLYAYNKNDEIMENETIVILYDYNLNKKDNLIYTIYIWD